jgi:hypothetical protein
LSELGLNRCREGDDVPEFRVLRCRIVLGVCLALIPSLASAQMSEAIPLGPTVDSLRAQAVDLEAKKQWEGALQAYFHLCQLDKANPEYRDKTLHCLRHVLQSHRHRDKSFQEKVLSLSVVQTGTLYEEVLDKLQGLYVDRNKVQVNKLFRAGLEEFISALHDAEYRQLYLKDVTLTQIDEFCKRITDVWTDRPLKTPKEARLCAATIARSAFQQLGIKPNLALLEFICGACNSLDEYSAYLTPADLDDADVCPETSIVDAAILREGVAYLRITHFRDSTPSEFDATMNAFKATMEGNNLRGLVIDLRGNAGGDFQAAVRLAERFLNRGVIATTMGQAMDANKIFAPTPGVDVLDIGLVLLVDSKTASAAEVLAHALRDQERAKIVGMPTFGKGTIQQVFQFATAQETDEKGKPKNRSGAIRITLARIFSPNGQPISSGLTPQMIVPNPEQQLVVALREASNFPTMMPR